jgi:diguanylate cyclase (GGDEF)-like protein
MEAIHPPNRPERISPETFRMFLVINYVCYVGLFAHAMFVPLFTWLGVPALALFNLASVAMWWAARELNRRGKLDIAVVLIKLEVAAHATLAVTLLGWDSGFHFYLWPLIVFAGLNDRISPRSLVLEVTALFVLYATLYWFGRDIHFSAPNDWIKQSLPFINVGVVFTAMGMLAFYFRLASAASEQRLKVLASTDDLTGLTNRRRMIESLQEEVARIRRSGRPATLVIADIDHFKRFNDSYGHACGDRVLQAVAQTLRGRLRTQDIISRWGGEEFLFMLPETDVVGAEIASRKLREAVAQQRVDCDGRKLAVTMTFGIAPLDAKIGIDESISHADDALYRGKEAGRDRIEKWVPLSVETPAPAVTESK